MNRNLQKENLVARINKMNKFMKYLALIIVFLSVNLYGQWGPHNTLGEEEYQVIKDLFEQSEKNISLYKYTDFDRTWSHFFTSKTFLELKNYDSMGPMTFNELLKELDNEDFEQIRWSIYNSIPLKWDPQELPSKFRITNSFTKKSDIAKRVHRITKPIILTNLAIVFIKTFDEGKIIFLKKNHKGNWEVIHIAFVWLSLH